MVVVQRFSVNCPITTTGAIKWSFESQKKQHVASTLSEKTFIAFVFAFFLIAYFRVPKTLALKTRLSAKWVCLYENKKSSSCQWHCTLPLLETEAWGCSEMAYIVYWLRNCLIAARRFSWPSLLCISIRTRSRWVNRCSVSSMDKRRFVEREVACSKLGRNNTWALKIT